MRQVFSIDKTTFMDICIIQVLATSLAITIGLLLLLLTGESYQTALKALISLFVGSFGSISALSETLTASTPLIFAALGIAIGFRAGLFNIGAEGQIIVGGISGKSNRINYQKNQTTSGRVPNGAIVEKEVKVTREDQLNVTLVLNKPDFTMSSKVVKALKNNGFNKVSAVDAGSILIPIAEIADMPYVDIIQKIESTI